MEFEWAPAKAAANLRKHKVSFYEAVTVFADFFSMTRLIQITLVRNCYTLQSDGRTANG